MLQSCSEADPLLARAGCECEDEWTIHLFRLCSVMRVGLGRRALGQWVPAPYLVSLVARAGARSAAPGLCCNVWVGEYRPNHNPIHDFVAHP